MVLFMDMARDQFHINSGIFKASFRVFSGALRNAISLLQV